MQIEQGRNNIEEVHFTDVTLIKIKKDNFQGRQEWSKQYTRITV